MTKKFTIKKMVILILFVQISLIGCSKDSYKGMPAQAENQNEHNTLNLSSNAIEPSNSITALNSSNYKDFNPGNYISDVGGNSDTWFNSTLIRLNNTNDPQKHWKGILIRTGWTDYETTKNTYNFSKLRSRLQAIANYPGRRLIIFFGLKSFDVDSHVVPAYVRTTEYADAYGHKGEYQYGSQNNVGAGGQVICMHVPNVRARFTALFQAMKTYFELPANNHLIQYIEGFVFNELSVTHNDSTVNTGPFENAWFNGHKDFLINLSKNVWPKKWFWQWINAPRARMATFVPQIVTGGIGIGAPDLVDEDIGLNFNPSNSNTEPGNMWHLDQNKGIVAIMAHMSSETLNSSIANKSQGCKCETSNGQTICLRTNLDKPYYPGPAKSRQHFQTFAKAKGATHVLWASQGSNHVTHKLPLPKSQDPNNKCNLPAIYSQKYPGQNRNTVTDSFIHNPNSDTSVNTAQPQKGLLSP